MTARLIMMGRIQMISITLTDGRTKFSLNFSGKFNFITGLSGTRKTMILKLMQKFRQGIAGIKAKIRVNGVPLGRTDIFLFSNDLPIDEISIQPILKLKNKICIVDETSQLLHLHDSAGILKKSENYFLIISRELFGYLPISIDSVYRIENNNGILVNVPAYCNKNTDLINIRQKIAYILTEDSKSSRLFFEYYSQGSGVEICTGRFTLNGRSVSRDNAQIVNAFNDAVQSGIRDILVVFDAAAFGAYYDAFCKSIEERNAGNVSILSWDSFETYLLQCPPFSLKMTKDDAGCKYNSLEQLSAEKLDQFIKYDKSKLSGCLKGEECHDCKMIACNFRNMERNFIQYPVTEVLKHCKGVKRAYIESAAHDSTPDETQGVCRVNAF